MRWFKDWFFPLAVVGTKSKFVSLWMSPLDVFALALLAKLSLPLWARSSLHLFLLVDSFICGPYLKWRNWAQPLKLWLWQNYFWTRYRRLKERLKIFLNKPFLCKVGKLYPTKWWANSSTLFNASMNSFTSKHTTSLSLTVSVLFGHMSQKNLLKLWSFMNINLWLWFTCEEYVAS